MDKGEESQPHNRSDVNTKGRWDGIADSAQKRFGGPNHHRPWQLIDVCCRIPRQHHTTKLRYEGGRKELGRGQKTKLAFTQDNRVFYSQSYHKEGEEVKEGIQNGSKRLNPCLCFSNNQGRSQRRRRVDDDGWIQLEVECRGGG